MSAETSSLDRFLRNRASAFLGLAGARASVFINGAIGFMLSALGLGMIAGGIATGEPQMPFAAAGPLFGGGVNLWVARLVKRRTSEAVPTVAKLTDEAQAFLHRILRHAFGWRYAWVGWDERGLGHRGILGRKRRLIRMLMATTNSETDQRAASAFLPASVFAILDAASQRYNRIQGVMATWPTGVGGSLGKIRPAILQAADETMAAILHQTAMIEKYPEGSSASQHAAEHLLNAMQEAADRVEALQAREPTVVERLTPVTTMDSVLEDLRMDAAARSELQAEGAKAQEQQVQGLEGGSGAPG